MPIMEPVFVLTLTFPSLQTFALAQRFREIKGNDILLIKFGGVLTLVWTNWKLSSRVKIYM